MYGITRKLLKDEYEVEDVVLIESPFVERTRVGAYRDTVLLAITPDKFVIATEKNDECRRKHYKACDIDLNNFALEFIYSLDSVKITVFKKTQRQSLKVVFDENNTRYFELGRIHPRKLSEEKSDIPIKLCQNDNQRLYFTMTLHPANTVFWELWCQHINEIKSGSSLWPYGKTISSAYKNKNTLQWTDKHLYLGSKRDTEDKIRPIPIPGLGRTEEVKLLYFKPEHFEGCDQDKRLVKCDQRDPLTQYEVFTYADAGAATSNLTYTSLMTTVGIIGQF